MTEGLAFRFADQLLIARAGLTLWWPEERALVVSDLHLGKSLRMARRGGALLPPWDTQETLNRLRAEITALNPDRLILLGDSYDDTEVMSEISAEDQSLLDTALQGRHCDWIEGNHDPRSGGVAEVTINGLTFRHELGQGPDVSGHFHPSVRLGGRRWRCFVYDEQHLILPSFGSYTGGLDIYSPDFAQVMPSGTLIAGTAQKLFTTRFANRRG